MTLCIISLRKKGIRIPVIIKTSDNKSYISIDSKQFFVIEKINGRRLREADELPRLFENLALLHKKSQLLKYPDYIEKQYYPLNDWFDLNYKSYNKLKILKKEVASFEEKSDFDLLFLKHVDSLIVKSKQALNMFDTSTIKELDLLAKENKTLIHHDYVRQNILITDDNEFFVYDFDAVKISHPIIDLQHTLFKHMKKCNWSYEHLVDFLKSYQKVTPLTKNEYHILIAALFFPQSITTLIFRYYKNRKRFNEKDHKNSAVIFNDLLITEIKKEHTLQLSLKNLTKDLRLK